MKINQISKKNEDSKIPELNLYSLYEISKRTDIPISTLRYLVKTKNVPVQKIGRKIFIHGHNLSLL